MECLFCKIARKEIPSDTVFENDKFVCFKDINPKAPVHLLIIPKKHVSSVDDLKEGDESLVGEMILLAKKIALNQGISENGYRLVFNVGKGAGQTVEHLHLHLMGGWKENVEI
jgi:histidine triad (HIT) family protein